MSNPKVSIVIVNYHSEKLLVDCLNSFFGQKVKLSLEVIVVDNGNGLSSELVNGNSALQIVKLIKNNKNLGFAKANNIGVKAASGKYVFFLNPDTIVGDGAIDKLVDFMEKHVEAGIVAPLLLDKKYRPYPLQGTGKLTPLTALVVFSFLNKYWPNNQISYSYWLKDWSKKDIKEVDVVPGSALLIRKRIFEDLGGFDENFFLYFEEADLCKRVKEKGWGIFINPSAKIIHFWGKCTPASPKIRKFFFSSRFYYFRKHFGILAAVIVELILRSSEWLAQWF